MRPSKTASVEEIQTIGRFESLRKILLSDVYAEHLDKPLAYWAFPTDRRLPLAFLSRILRELLDTPFDDLSRTPGIGQKKMASFVKLLARAANTDPAELPTDIAQICQSPNTIPSSNKDSVSNGFDPSVISEMQWEQWRTDILRHGLADEKLGRFASSLRNLTKVVWNKPLSAYADYSLIELQTLKTHGKKRVNAILEVFHDVHSIVTNLDSRDHLVLRLAPRLIDQVEQWIGQKLQTPELPDNAEIFNNFVSPILEQIRIDASQQIVAIAENRLGIRTQITSVRQVARSMGLTRARVYQLLNEINDIMTVRWPLGRHQVYQLHDKFVSDAANIPNPPSLEQFLATVELIFPGRRRGADGPIDHSSNIAEEEFGLLEV